MITETYDEIQTNQPGLSDVADRVPGGEIPNEDFITQEDGVMTSGDQSRQEVSTSIGVLAHPKHQQRIACWNVKTMYQLGKTAQVCKEMRRYNIDILGVSECRWTGFGKMQTQTGETILYSGREDQHQHGVAVIMKKNAAGALMSWKPVSERIIVARFNSKHIKATIVQTYAPTNDAKEEDKNKFYNQLQQVYSETNSHDLVITMGDLNAKIGYQMSGEEGIVGQHALVGERSDNGERFVALCMENNMAITTTQYPHKDIHKYTWTSPDGRTKNQIDHIAINGKFRNSITDARTYRGADAATDHNLVMCKLKLKLSKVKKDRAGVKKYDTSKLNQRAVRDKFTLELRNRFNCLQVEDDEYDDAAPEDSTVEKKWSNFKDIYNQTAEKVLGYRRRKVKPWISPDSWKQIEERGKIKQALDEAKSDRIKARKKEQYRLKDIEVKRALRRDKRKWMDSIASEAEESAARGHMKGVYDAAKILCNTRNRTMDAVKDKSGKLLTTEDAVKKRWEEHFCEVLNRPVPEAPAVIGDNNEELDISDAYITKEEIKRAIKETASGKAAGIDAITAEVLKVDLETAANTLEEIFRCIWDKEIIPDDWKKGIIVKLPKKGDLTVAGNWRGITLLCLPAKIMGKVIIRRLRDQVDAKLRREQAGFRPGRGTREQIFTLRNIIEQSLEWNATLMLVFIDYMKAFDSIHQETLWKIMKLYGVPSKFIKLVRMFYTDVKCSVVSEGGLTNWFDVKSGVKQGCVMSGFLFLLVVDWIMSQAVKDNNTGIRWNMMEQLEDLDFADDIALLASNWNQLRRKLDRIKEYGDQTGLRINIGKTKSMSINANNNAAFSIDGEEIEEVDSFTYLGSEVSKGGGAAEDIRRRTGKACAAFYRLSKVWKNSNIFTKTKVKILMSNVVSVLLYGCESWRMTRQAENRLDVLLHRWLRRILRIDWTLHVTNEEVRRRAGVGELLSETVRKRRWTFIGHTLRRDGKDLAKKALTWTPAGRRNRGRPKETYRRTVERERNLLGLNSWSAAAAVASDRAAWRDLIRSATVHRGHSS